MNKSFKLFNFQGSPVSISIWFLLLFFFLSFGQVFIVFLSILIHEMSHAFVANKKGYDVYGINIDLFSGSANISNNMHERDSIYITAAGPISNLLLCLLSYTIGLFFTNSLVEYSTFINGILFLFNILPIYPMDGGRIFRDALVLKMRNRSSAFSISNWTSLTTSILLFITSCIYLNIFLIIFSLYFTYLSLKELKIIK